MKQPVLLLSLTVLILISKLANAANESPLYDISDNLLQADIEEIISEIGASFLSTVADKKEKNNGNFHVIMGYEPGGKMRAKGNVRISRKLTTKIIPSRIDRKISDVFDLMDKWTATSSAVYISWGKPLKVFDFDFYDKDSGKKLYCVANRVDSRGFKWEVVDELFSADMIAERFHIYPDQLPDFPVTEATFEKIESDTENIQKILSNFAFRKSVLKKTRWHKIPIFHQKNNKKRIKLYLTKQEFMQNLSGAIDESDEISLVPVVMFDSGNNNYRVEYIWIIRLLENVDIGLSVVYSSLTGEIRIGGIHLDKEMIKKQHKLLFSDDQKNQDLLRNFRSIINYMAIGNPDDVQNQLNAARKMVLDLKLALQQKNQTFSQ